MTNSPFKTGVVKKQHNIGSLLNQALAQTKIHRIQLGLLPERHHFSVGLPLISVRYLTQALRHNISSFSR
jgi:hypothetical protein